jgi:hypothetical protein
VNLSPLEVQAAYYGLAGFIRDRKLAGRKIQPEVVDVMQRLDAHVRLSSTRHETGSAPDEPPSSGVWIGSTATAQMLGRDIRWVQRHAQQLGGRRNGGRWFFPESTVIDYAQSATHQRD